MTYQEIYEIAKKLDKKTQDRIDKEVGERLKILEEGELTDEQMEEMEDCMYVAFVLQEYLNSEYEILDEERLQILAEMEDLYNEYVDMLARARIEEKVSKKKRMALQLMQIREQLFGHKDHMQEIKVQMKNIQSKSKTLDNLTSKESIKNVAKENKELLNKNKDLEKQLDKQKNITKEQGKELEKNKMTEPSKTVAGPVADLAGKIDRTLFDTPTVDKLELLESKCVS